MALLDFLTQPHQQIGQGPTIAPIGPQDQELQTAPVMTEKPSLLSGAWNWVKSPEGRMAISNALYTASGDDEGLANNAQLDQTNRAQQLAERRLAEQKAERAAKNAAFRAAYRPDASGKVRFDPAAYVGALGGDAEADLGEVANLWNAMAPKVGVSGDTPYSIDDQGQVEWGTPREASAAEKAAAAREAEIERHNREMERLGLMNHETSDYRAHKAPAGRGGAAAPSWLPPGATVVHVPGGA